MMAKILAGVKTLLYLRIVIQSKKADPPKGEESVLRCDNVARFCLYNYSMN